MLRLFLLLGVLLAGPPAFGAGTTQTIPECPEAGVEQPGETICITGEPVGCLPEEVEVNGMCMNRAFLDFLCGFIDCGGGPGPGTGEPGQPGDDNPGGAGNEETPKPTQEQCQDAYRQCQDEILKAGLAQCEVDEGRSAAIRVFQGRTCIGDPNDIWEDLFVFTGPTMDGPFVGEESDFGGDTDISKQCTGAFIFEAASQCANGRDATSDPGIPFSVTFPIPGFPSIGIGIGSGSVTVERRGGAGYQELCSAAAGAFATTECGKLRTQCQQAAGGAPSPLTLPPPTTAELLARVDEERLGLSPGGIGGGEGAGGLVTAFRGTRQGRSESDTLYRFRLEFLGDWSEFLAATGLAGDPQGRVELSFKRAQAGYVNAHENWITLVIGIWLPDPETGRMGTPEIPAAFRAFAQNNDFTRRAAQAEATLFLEIRSVLGDDFLRAFRQDVWPGIDRFGIARPMRPLLQATLE